MPGHVQKFYKVLVCLAIVSSLLIGVYVSLIPSFVYTYTPQEVVEVPVTSVADTRLKSPPALHEHSQLVNGSSIPETNSVENSKRSLERAPLYMNMSNMSNKHTRLLMSEPQAERNGDEKRQVSKMSKMEYPPRQASSATVHPDIHSPQTVISQLDSSDGCSVLPCLNVLSSSEKNTYNECHKKALVLLKDVEECKCRFVNGTGRKRVALVSLPGSGNTWVRGLLEKTTGICTGTLFCDKNLKKAGMCGEGLGGTNVVAVKTHLTTLKWGKHSKTDPNKRPFDKAIFIIRNPFNANIAEWHRQKTEHVQGQAGSNHIWYVSSHAYFGDNPGWQNLVKSNSNKWQLMIQSNLVDNAERPVLVVFYEDLKQDLEFQIRRMLEFLDLPLSKEKLNATLQEGFATFYRNHQDSFNHYTSEQKVFVNSVISRAAVSVRTSSSHSDISSRLMDYIWH